MSNHAQHHIIREIQLEASATGRENAFTFQRELGFLFHTSSFRSKLEAAFNELVTNEAYIKIDRLDLDIQLTRIENFSSDFIDSLSRAIREKIDEGHPVEKQVEEEKFFESAVLSFLWFGTFPSSMSSERRKEVILRLQHLANSVNSPLLKLVMQAVVSDHLVAKRMVNIIPEEEIRSILVRTYHFPMAFFEAFRKENFLENWYYIRNPGAGSDHQDKKIRVLHAFILQKVSEGRTAEEITEWLTSPEMMSNNHHSANSAISDNNKQPAGTITDIAERKSRIKSTFQKTGYLVHNAGMVLIASELIKVLKTAGLVVENNFPDSEAQQRAILLLYFLNSGHLDALEDELLLNKVLCGWPIYEPVDLSLKPEKLLRETARQQLQHLILDWKEVNPPSLLWLQKNFLNRGGRLSKREDENWMLEVNREVQDIVFESVTMRKCLPGLVKYPWLNKLVFIRW